MHDFKCVSLRVHASLCLYLCQWVGLSQLVIDWNLWQTHQTSRNKMLPLTTKPVTQILSKTPFTLLKWQFSCGFPPSIQIIFFIAFFFPPSISWWERFIQNMSGAQFEAFLTSNMLLVCAEWKRLWTHLWIPAHSQKLWVIFLAIWTTLKTRLSTFRAPGGRTRGTISRRYQKQSTSQFHIAFTVPPFLLGAKSVVIPNENECPSTPCQHIHTCTCTNLQFTSSAPEFPLGADRASPSIWFLIPSPYKLFVWRMQLLMLIPQCSTDLLESPSFNKSYCSVFCSCRHIDVTTRGERFSTWGRRGGTQRQRKAERRRQGRGDSEFL